MAESLATAEITCAQCGSTFTVARKRNWHNYRYCGPNCARTAKRAYRPQYLREFAKRPLACVEHGTKVCRECAIEKPVRQFNKSTNYADGRTNSCRACLKAYAARLAAKETSEHRTERLAKHRARTAKWKQENRDKVRASTARSRLRNTERHKRWRKANPDKWAAVVRARDGRRRGGIGAIGGRKMREWVEAQKKACHWCGKPCAGNFHVDHIIPLRRGGAHEARNLCIACPSCNQRKHAKDPIDFAREIGKLL
jgi:5-methylcytosine-specific restriction endonuclease McrA